MQQSIQSIVNHSFLLNEDSLPRGFDIVCLSHLQWNSVYQRPQQLLSRCAQNHRVFYIEEPVMESISSWWLDVSEPECGVWVGVPHLPNCVNNDLVTAMHQSLMDELFEEYVIANPILWYYTPAALSSTHHLQAAAVVYDCMDELSASRGAATDLQELEQQLLQRVDVAFTTGQGLYEAKRHLHSSIHVFPGSIEAADFAQAKIPLKEPIDQRAIPHPRIGFHGVIDEWMDLELLNGIAQDRPDWHLVLIGPVARIERNLLLRHPNIHYLGRKSYQNLPNYLAGWDVAMLPFIRDESTRLISPTPMLEYLAAGTPVVSTSIRDVVCPDGQQDGQQGLVHIADTVTDFVVAIEQAMEQRQQDADWLNRVDQFLAQNSWDRIWANMIQRVSSAIANQGIEPDAGRSLMTFQPTSNISPLSSTQIQGSSKNRPLKR